MTMTPVITARIGHKKLLKRLLVSLFDLSISSRIFPDNWKMAKVCPLFKSGSIDDASNFRPISIIPTIGKLLERLVHIQSIKFLEFYYILLEAQSGFRAGHSTCLVDFIDNIIKELIRVVSVEDLARAFDTVDHARLLYKLECYGFRYGMRKWFGDDLSSPRQVKCWVPQGSILGPLLFICYINDLQQHCHDTKLYMNADDSTLVSVDLEPNVVSNNSQTDLNDVSTWFKVDRLSVNCAKTQAILFTSHRSKHKQFQLNLELDGQPLNQVLDLKYLGLTLDRHLMFEKHVSNICQKVNIRTKMLWHIRNFIPRSLAKILYQSQVYPHFTYCNFIIDAASENLKTKLQCWLMWGLILLELT